MARPVLILFMLFCRGILFFLTKFYLKNKVVNLDGDHFLSSQGRIAKAKAEHWQQYSAQKAYLYTYQPFRLKGNAFAMRLLIICCLCGLCCAGCGFREPLFEVIDGNYKFVRGDYTGATISYINALGKKSYEEWIYYNIGNVYNALGETDAAIEELSLSINSKNSDVLFSAHFNLGNIYYNLGRYEKAIDHYCKALKAKQRAIDAKINLELAITHLEKEQSIEQNSSNSKTGRKETKGSDDEKKETDTGDILIYIKEREAEIWKSLNQNIPEQIKGDNW